MVWSEERLLTDGADACPPIYRALVSANLLGTRITTDEAERFARVLTEHATLKSLCGNKGNETTLDMSGRNLCGYGAIMLAPEIEKNQNLVSINILNNRIGVQQMQAMLTISKRHAALTSLCGNKGDETEMNLSKKMHGSEDALLVAREIVKHPRLRSLDISHNSLQAFTAIGQTAEQQAFGAQQLADAIEQHP